MDHWDRQAIKALLIKQVRYQEVVAKQTPIRDAASVAIADATTGMTHVQTALRAFGFEPTDTSMWEKVRLELGEEAWNDAFDIARGVYGLTKTDYEEDEEAIPSIEEFEKLIAEFPPEPQPQERGRIRDVVIERLKLAGSDGTQAGAIRKFIVENEKLNIHSKTVGMTLWRLSKDGLARREGRTWFYGGADPDSYGEKFFEEIAERKTA